MSNWKNKSNQNKASAKLLIKNNNFSASIHCSYYCNIQLMLHILLNDFGKTEREIGIESKQGAIDQKGFHNWLKNTITRNLMNRDFMILRDFNNFFWSIKKFKSRC